MTRGTFVSVAIAVALAAPVAAFAVMKILPSIDPVLAAPRGHFVVVSMATVASGAIGAGLMMSVESLRNTRSVFLALGFVAIAVIFAAHGLGTPGFILPAEAEYMAPVAISAGLSAVTGAGFIALSALPARLLPGRSSTWAPWVVGAAMVALGGYVFVCLARPESLAFVPRTEEWDTGLAAGTIALLAFSAWRYWQAWRLTRFSGQVAMVAALVLLAEAQISMYYGELWRLSWWLYHGLLLAAFLVLLSGWGMEARRAKSLVLFSRALALRDELDRVNLSQPESLHALESAMGDKDEYTREHMGRVAMYGEAMAREMLCEPRLVRVVEAAGRIHDIGKIAVPDAVLLKPGKLTEGEFEQMKHHTLRGEHIASRSPALREIAAIVRSHHERWDGRGYPDGRPGDQIPLAARIIAVADTFDALTSPRVYRGPKPLDEALAELARVSGAQLDPMCVEAFLAWFERKGIQRFLLQRAA
jgi:HD-GYP domain-containing protein (c-di-GMP phosphodiesterase class II)